jgi:iron complex outermembrane receptor protein
MPNLVRLMPILLATAAVVPPAGARAQDVPAVPVEGQEAVSDADGIPDIVVTAQKREQRLQEVPISIAVIGAEKLERMQVNSGTEVARQTANLRVSNLGNEDQPKFAMRGIATPEFNLNATSPTGVFYDEVYIATQWLGGPQIFDMERVEVLRGPQGTLFGKNTTGGAINFITRAPSFDSGGYVTVEGGTNHYFHAMGAVEAPLVDDKLAGRVAFNITRSDGWVENHSQLTGARDLSSINNYAIRGSLRYSSGDFGATLRLMTSHSSPTNIGVIAYGLGPGGTIANGVNPRVNPYTGAPFSVHEGAYDHVGEIIADGSGGYLTMNLGLGDRFTLTSITSYFDGNFKNTVDADGTITNFFSIDFFAWQHEFSQDLRLASDLDGPFNFIVGLYYTNDEVDIETNYRQSGLALFDQTYNQSRKSYAAYFDATFDITDEAQAYGGIRWTSDHGRLRDYQVLTALPPFILPGIPLQPTLKYDDNEPTGRLGLRYRFTPDVMAYAQYARGYRSSAFNGGALAQPEDLNVADPEKLDAYEVGLKSQLFDRRLQLNASAFYYDFRNQQFLNAVNVGGVQASQLINVGRARIQGLEIEAVAEPVDGLSLSAGLGLLDSEYKELVLPDPVNNVPTDLAGNRLIEAPKATLNLAADYDLPIGDDHMLTFHADAVHVSKQFFTAFNDPNATSDPFWEANARVAYENLEHGYEVALWVKNLNNNTEETGTVLNYGSLLRFTTIPYPRRWGVSLNYEF